MEDAARAEFVGWIAPSEPFDELLSDAKARTWETEIKDALWLESEGKVPFKPLV